MSGLGLTLFCVKLYFIRPEHGLSVLDEFSLDTHPGNRNAILLGSDEMQSAALEITIPLNTHPPGAKRNFWLARPAPQQLEIRI